MAHKLFVSLFVILGLALTLLLVITDESSHYNNSVWFYSHSKLVAWVFTVGALWTFLQGKSRTLQAGILCLVVALSVPSTLQHLGRQQFNFIPTPVGKTTVEMVTYIQKACDRGEAAVFSRLEWAMMGLALTRCRTPIADIGCAFSFAAEPDLIQRKRDLRLFWDQEAPDAKRRQILERYRVDYVIEDKRQRDLPKPESYTGSPPVFENKDFRIFAVGRRS
jgi:uncharacterized membrane protein